MPFLTESGILWEMRVLIHNVQASSADTSDTLTDSQAGNLVENSNNGGYLVSNDESIFMIEYADSIVKIDKETEEKEFIIGNEQEYWFSDLNLVDEWLYFTDDDALKRIKTDGTDEQTIYDLGFLSDVQTVNGTVYFINRADNNNLYQMDLDGENLERFLDVNAADIAVYEDYLLVSHGEEDASRVERVDLDGTEK